MRAMKLIGQMLMTPVVAILMPLMVAIYLGGVIYHTIRTERTDLR